MLKKFFAVTHSGSLYEITDERDENGWPIVRRIVNGPSATTENFRLKDGKFVGISDLGICLFDDMPKYGRKFEHMNIRYWGGCTSGFVALFLDKSAAEVCLASEDRTFLSAQFQAETRATLEAIGNDHPVFEIGDSMQNLLCTAL